MKTLGVDYTEDAITARIAGGPRPSRQPKQRDDRIRLLYDLQSKQGGLQHWAKLQNLKLAARTINFLTEHGIDSYGELESKSSMNLNELILFANCLQMIFWMPWAPSKAFCTMEAWKEVLPFDKR